MSAAPSAQTGLQVNCCQRPGAVYPELPDRTWYVMSNLNRRLKKPEALLIDDAGLVPGSPQWLAYWTERADKILNGDDEGRGCQIPLEVVDAILEASQRARF